MNEEKIGEACREGDVGEAYGGDDVAEESIENDGSTKTQVAEPDILFASDDNITKRRFGKAISKLKKFDDYMCVQFHDTFC
ncbi:hypothetical protein NDU88_003186 [Pleurodeles waltl]|uniref:Uncharacterized protein n=1 Tax=Pleurodeles waltl TaxID=8319 RepID=A0AAV7SCQ4_PLEWA|nr:hypothetical protein NDU88_003186 [Pleurodeles waltl]